MVLLAWISLAPSALEAQQTQLEAQFVTRLGAFEGEGIIPGMVRSVARDANGHFWVTVYEARQRPVVFDSEGEVLFSVGGIGEGPGEFRGSVIVRATKGDSVFLLDPGNGRLTTLDLEGKYRWSRPVPLPAIHDFAVLPGRRVIVSASIRVPDRVGLPLHLYENGTTTPRSFGADIAIYHSGRQRALHRAIATAPDGSFWTLHRTQFVLEQRDVEGNLVRSVRRDPDWFRPASRHDEIPAERTPFPQFVDLQIENGLIWLSALIPQDDWHDGYTYGRSADGRPNWVVEDIDDALDTVIQVLNLEGNQIAEGRFDQVIPVLLGSGYVASLETYLHLAPVVDIWRLNLSPPHSN